MGVPSRTVRLTVQSRSCDIWIDFGSISRARSPASPSGKVTEKVNQDLNLMSCSDGSDFIGESYHQGDIVLCVRKDAELFQAQARTGAADHAETAAEVHEKVAEEKRSE